MQEFKRIFASKTFLFTLLAIVLVNAALFYNEQKENDYGLDLSAANEIVWDMDGGMTISEQTDAEESYARYLALLGKYQSYDPAVAQAELTASLSELKGADKVAATALLEQLEHICGYDDYLAGIEASKDKLLNFSIFNSTDSFSGRNIIKTAEDFKGLSGVSLALDNDIPITAFMNARFTDYLAILLLIVLCISFLAERKKGLWSLVYATPKGRLPLYAKRAGILFTASLLTGFFLYGSNLLLCVLVYGGIGDLSRPVQSIASLGTFPVTMSVGEMLLEYIAVCVISLFLVAMLLNLLLAAIDNVKYSVVGAAAFMGLEYVLYAFLPVQSAANGLKYFNVFTYISISELYGNYLNINLFGYPFSIRDISFGAMLPLISVLFLAYLFVGHRKKPMAARAYFEKYTYALNRVSDTWIAKLRLAGMECHKVLIIQKGAVVLLLLLLLVPQIEFVSSSLPTSKEEAAAEKIILQLEGAVTEETYAQVDEIQNGIDLAFADFEAASEKYQQGEMEYEEYYVFELAYESAKLQNDALQIVKTRLTELETLKAEQGTSPWLIYEPPYEKVYGSNTKSNQQKAAMIAVLCLSLALAGVFSYEKQSGTDMLISSCVNGRKRLLIRKYGVCMIVAVFVWAAVYGTEFYRFFEICHPATLAAPIQSLSLFAKFPVHCSIAAFLVMLYLFRLLMLCCVGSIVLLISSRIKKVSTSYIAAVGAVAVPSAVYYFIGISQLQFVSTTVPVSAISLLLNTQGALGTVLTAGAIMVILAGLCTFLVRKQLYIADNCGL